MEEKVSIKQFARDLGVSDTAVGKAIKSGKIVAGVVKDEKGRPWIVPSIAMREWGESYNPAYGRKPKVYDKLDAAAGNQQAPAFDSLDDEQPAPQVQAPADPGRKSIVELKRLQMEIRVQTEAIELRKRKGELVEKKTVYGQLFAMGAELRSSLQAIPDRTIDSILAARDRNEAHSILYNAIAEALNALADFSKREIG